MRLYQLKLNVVCIKPVLIADDEVPPSLVVTEPDVEANLGLNQDSNTTRVRPFHSSRDVVTGRTGISYPRGPSIVLANSLFCLISSD